MSPALFNNPKFLMFDRISKITLNVRKNHAIEHATVSVLLAEGKKKSAVLGFAIPTGFIISSKSNKNEILSAARSGLKLIQSGDEEVSISQFCGTNIVVAAFISGVSTLLISRILGKKSKNILNMANGFILSSLFSKPIGRLVQKYVTTNSNVKNIKISKGRSIKLGSFYIHYVSTSYPNLSSD